MLALSDYTIVACVESGPLEIQTCRLVESIRTWGGALANAPVLAVTPRFGPGLTRATLGFFEHHGVRHIRYRSRPEYAWFTFANKPKAWLAAQEHARTEGILWLDSDVLVVREPNALELGEQEEFAACCTDKNIASRGPQDPFEDYWRRVAGFIGLDLESFPWVPLAEGGGQVRLYFNAGVIAFRRRCALPERHWKSLCSILSRGLVPKVGGIFYTEQVALALTVQQLGLTHRLLPLTHNLTMRPEVSDEGRRALPEACILHYRGSMWPEHWNTFLRQLKEPLPSAHAWLEKQGPLHNPAPLPHRVLRRLQLKYESWRSRSYGSD
ncbi:MAG: hypothetical protein ACYTG2_12335 [Planctomycetota bacterium]